MYSVSDINAGDMTQEAANGALSGAAFGASFGPIGAAVGGVLGGAWGALTSWTSSSHKAEAQRILDRAQDTINSKVNSYSNWAKDNTGAAAVDKARGMAKSKTGTLTAQTSQSQAYAAEDAQRNAGISKAQAAMSGQNTVGATYDENYNTQYENQLNSATEAINAEVEAKYNALQSEIESIRTKAQAEAESEASKTFISDAASAIGSGIKKVGSAIGGFFKNIFSDEELKYLEEAELPETVLQVLETLNNMTEEEVNDPANKLIIDNAVEFLKLFIAAAKIKELETNGMATNDR